MSERQAKIKRKNEIKETPKRKKSALDIVFNIIIVVLILAVLGIGGWAVYNKYSQMPDRDASETTMMTLGEYAQAEGISVEEFLIKYGVANNAELNAESTIYDIVPQLTLANYAKLSGTDVATMKEDMGLGNEYTDDTLMSVIFENMYGTEQPETSAEKADGL